MSQILTTPEIGPLGPRADFGGAGSAPSLLSRFLSALAKSPTLRVIGKRVLVAIPVLWGVTFLTFGVMNLLPGNAAQALLGEHATKQQVQALSQRLHLNEPFLTRYWHWLTNIIQGNLGSSLTNQQSVSKIIAQRLPVSAELVVYAFVAALVIAIPLAILAARKPGGIADRVSIVLSMVGLSIAPFIFALVLILVFAVYLGWLPAIGFVPLTQNVGASLKSMTLPAASLWVPIAGAYTRLLRADLVEQSLAEDYVVTAKAKGAGPWRTMVRHVLKNAMFPLLTLVGLNLGTLIGGTVIIEEIFGLPGIGQELLQAINNRDVIVVEGTVLVFAIIVVACNLLTDIFYSVLDPRIRYGRSGD